MANTERTREVERAARAAGELNARNVDDAEYIAAHPTEFTGEERRLAEQTLALPARAAFAIAKGDAVYAKRGGNTTYAWYVIDRPVGTHGGTGYITAYAHREHGAGRPRFMLFVDIKHHDGGRYA